MTMDIDSTNNASNKAEEEEERKISVHPVREKKTETRNTLRERNGNKIQSAGGYHLCRSFTKDDIPPY
jgi:hypothetical protein